MVPVLLNLGFLKIYTFGVFLTLSFFWASFFLWKVIRLTSYKEEDIFDGLFFAMFGSLFVSRLVYVITHFSDFGFNIGKFILINGYPGLSIYGGILGGFLTFALYFFIKKIDILDVFDYVISPTFLAMAIGKIGGFFSGVEYGEKTKFIAAIKYNGQDGLRHLTPLYEALIFGVLCYITYRFILEIRKDKLKRGFNFFFFLWSFSIVYFVFDKLKGNRLYFLGQSVNGVVSAILVLTFSFYFIYYFRGSLFRRFKLLLSIKPNYANKTHKRASNQAQNQTGKG